MSDTEKATVYTTETIREDLVQTSSWRFMQHKIGPEFDIWLAAHDAEQREAGRLAAFEEDEKAIQQIRDELYETEKAGIDLGGDYLHGMYSALDQLGTALRSSSPERSK